MMKSKKGSHIGMMISFFIFISIVFFSYFLISSFHQEKQSRFNELKIIEEKILNYISVETYSSTGFASTNGRFSCVFFTPEINPNGCFSVNESGDIIPTIFSEGKIYIETNGFFKTFYSLESLYQTNPSSTNCEEVSKIFTKKEKIILVSKINDLMQSEDLNSLLEINENIDFSIEFENSITKEVPKSKEIYSDEIELHVFDGNGFLNKKIRIYLW